MNTCPSCGAGLWMRSDGRTFYHCGFGVDREGKRIDQCKRALKELSQSAELPIILATHEGANAAVQKFNEATGFIADNLRGLNPQHELVGSGVAEHNKGECSPLGRSADITASPHTSLYRYPRGERRFMLLRISEERILDVITGKARIANVPDGALLISVHYDYEIESFCVKLWHAEFPIVPEAQYSPGFRAEFEDFIPSRKWCGGKEDWHDADTDHEFEADETRRVLR